MFLNWNVEEQFMKSNISFNNLSSGIISGILAITGPPIIILSAASLGNFSQEQTISWIFAVYFFGGLFSIIFPLLYKIPITGAHSLSAVIFLVTITSSFSFKELVGAYLITGLLIFIIGVSGLFTKLLKWFPDEIIASMLGGMVAVYIIQLVSSIFELPIVGIPSVLTYFIFIRWLKRFPAVLVAIIIAFIMLLLKEDINVSTTDSSYIMPSLYIPDFTIVGILTISIPLALIILSNDVAVGIGALKNEKFNIPINKVVTGSGFFTMITALFGGQSANLAGMMSAICAGDETGVKHKRYVSSVISGLIILLFGLLSWKIVPFIKVFPTSFIEMIAGFSLIGILGSALQKGFSNEKFRLSSTFTFAIAMSEVYFLNISAPVIALIVGSIVSKFIERN